MNTVGVALIGIALVAMLASEVLWAPVWMNRIRAAIASGSVSARTKMYRQIVASDWVYAVLAVELLLIADLSFPEMGFRLPNDDLNQYAPVGLGLLLGSAVAALLGRRAAKNKEAKSTVTVGDIDVLIPRTKTERRWFAAVAVTAGITEEISLRAMPILFFNHVLPGTSEALSVAATAILFGLAHYYQGLGGILGTAVLGAIFGAAFVVTGSLLVPIVLHCLLDLRVLLLPTPKQQFEVNA